MRFASMLSCDCSSSVDTCLLNAELFFVQCNKSRKYHFYTFSFEGASQNWMKVSSELCYCDRQVQSHTHGVAESGTFLKNQRCFGFCSLTTLVEISKVSGPLIKPCIPQMVIALLEALSGLESPVSIWLWMWKERQCLNSIDAWTVVWFNYVTLLQWKLSNNEVSLLNITLSGCSQNLVASNQCMK